MTESSEKNSTSAQATQGEPSMWLMAETGWAELIAAADKIQKAANLIKQSEHSIHGYNIERALAKHKPHLMQEHYTSLKEFREESKL